MPAPVTNDEFLDVVRQSRLVTEEELDAYLRAHPLPGEPSEVAATMVRNGLLTKFQAGQFLLGKWRGFLIAGKYNLLEHLGTGGMGSVFLCEHLSMQRRVAIKVLPPARAEDPGAVERFYREARAVAALDHPNLVRAHDIDHDGRLHFLVMEYVDGPALADVVRRTGPLAVARACNYVRQAALGLHHAHVAGLVHRDVKPGNLLVDRSGTVKILDMGLARFFHDTIDDITRRFDDNAALGTIDFLAPEQALDSHQADFRADVYSLGATCYAFLTGRTPFGPGTSAQKMLRQQILQPVPLRELRPEVPEGLAAVVMRMMAKSPADRYQAAAEVHHALASWDTAPAYPPSADEMPALSPRCRIAAPSSGCHSLPDAPSRPRSPTVAPSAATPLPTGLAAGPPPTQRAGPDWRGWAIIGLVAVLIASGTIIGVYWALSARRPVVIVQGGPAARPPGAESVAIRRDQNTRRVQTPYYEAVLEEDGHLVSLKAAGVEFLKTGVPLPAGQPARGAYLYSEKAQRIQPLPDMRQDANTVTARGGPAVVKIAFGDRAVGWSITDESPDDPMVFCVLFDRGVTAVTDGQGAWLPVPPPVPERAPAGYRVDLRADPASWFAGKAKLTLTGGGLAWGPAPTPHDGYEVWQVTVPPGATRRVSARIDEASPEELAEVARLAASTPRRGGAAVPGTPNNARDRHDSGDADAPPGQQ
jgi:serine/threonine protein kinase